METKTDKETYYKCRKCGDEIYWNTRKQMTWCKCKTIAVDGCEFYVRLTGDEKNFKEIQK
ncbi:hypothetical protein MYX06_02025 [Patescibacteria group bacterium AH-259-L05]|nr:hypothetical protein [Patescibacteria group bacterium AH-259-L05]